MFTGANLPQTNCSIVITAATGKYASIRREDCTSHIVRVTGKSLQVSAGESIPQTNCAVVASASNREPVR